MIREVLMPIAGLRLLDNPLVWNASRISLDLAFGLYRKRIARMWAWKLLDGSPSVIDIGCGVGYYARITGGGQYLGMDMNDRYIEYAKSCHHDGKIAFRADDVATLVDEGQTFDIALMVDFLHHIPDESVIRLLRTAGQLSFRHIVNLEPVTEQSNRVGDCFIKNDRGEYMRTTESLMNLFAQAGDKLKIVKCEKLQLGPISTLAILSAPL